MEQRKETLSYIQDASMIIVGIFFLALPLVFASVTTDAFTLPKQILLTGFVLISTILLCFRMFFEGKVRLQTTPFNLPLLTMVIVMFVSAILSLNRYDALIAFVPLLFSILAFFIIINMVRSRQALFMAISGLVAGGVIVSIISILAYFKVYIIPWADTHVQTFTPFGSLLDQAIFLALVLPLAGYIAYPLLARRGQSTTSTQAQDVLDATLSKRTAPSKAIAFGIAFIAIAAGLLVTVFMLVTIQKPLILPFETGFQTAFASISQDTGRVLWSFLFGSGVGTYLTDFTRFKAPAYNLDPNLWSFTFFRSSSFILELLATTGFLGVVSFLFLVFRILKEKAYFLPIVLAIVAAFLLPFSFTIILLFFILLALFSVIRSHNDQSRYPHTEFYFVAFRQGLLAPQQGHTEVQSKYAAVLPLIFFGIFIIFVGILGYFTVKFVQSDVMFQQSLVAASQNDGRKTYDLQTQAINIFPYRDAYYRIFSQTNLALANSLAAAQPQGSSPSAQVQQDILTLIQQSIASGRTAVNISPLSAMNWNNLSSIYRSLIGFGENAEQFAVLTNQQAIALDPNNPQQYINFGGIYYQLGAWDDAARQFQIAINLKSDYANAYYNLGHTYENQNKLPEALQMYQTVQQLVANDPTNAEIINKEIAALQDKIGKATATNTNVEPSANQEDLGVNEPEAQLPERDPREEIQGPPPVTPTPSKTSPTPSKAVTPTPER